MNRISWVLGLATLLAISSSTMTSAATPAKQHASQGKHAQAMSSAACPVSNPTLCGGSCPRATASTSASAASSVQKVNGTACPVSDPSKCPASCRPKGAVSTTAVAANTRH
jgi:hypothetical protein